ncbi:MAG TPA: Do family serine endopeptidase [Pyrinomonadaceae bacterium]|nr:Do family serine endopeptidase [Pyrinomonadaceae bacterium]
MNKKFLLVAIICAAAVFSGCKTGIFGSGDIPAPSQPTAPPAPLVVDGVRTSYADVVEKTSVAVVRIEADHKNRAPQTAPDVPDDFFRQFSIPRQNPGPRLERGLGSGVIVSADGTILTNNHVIEDADKITVQLSDDKTFEAKVIGSDKPSDLAVLKIEAQNLPFLTLGNSDNVRVGDIVLAIGNPLGIGQSVTAGIISAKGRRTGISDGSSYEDFLQTDAPINRGNSGGALVNLNSELIGINSQILSGGSNGGNIGIGFSIPSNMAKTVMEQLLKDGKVRRGMLGINIQNLTDDTAKAMELKDTAGVLVSNVKAGSAADKAGIKRGDVITAINGEKTEDSNVLRNKVAGTLPGTEIKLTVVRGGTPQELTATLEESAVETSANRDAQPGPDGSGDKRGQNGKLGLTLQPVTPQIAKQLELDPGTEGLVVTDVDADGAAAEAGVARGDVIMEINRQAVATVESVQSALEKSGDRPILLLVSRRGTTSFLTVRPQ